MTEGAAEDVLGKCPLCGGEIKESQKAFGCANWKANGCKFAVWKTVAQRPVTMEEAKELIANGRTGLLDGFVSKKGSNFSAMLVIKEGKVVFEFPPRT